MRMRAKRATRNGSDCSNAVAAAQNRQRDGRPLLRLVGEVMQPVRFESPQEFEAHRVAVSEVRGRSQDGRTLLLF